MPSSRRQKKLVEATEILQDPVRCVSFFLKCLLWSKQKEILYSLKTYRKTAVKACHASGKTFIAAAAVLWWLMTHPEGIVLTTAPTWRQVEQVLWAEIHSAVKRSIYVFPQPSATKLEFGPGRFALGVATDKGVNLQGFHSKHVLVIIDEAPGVTAEIYEAITSICAGGEGHVLALGNPVIASGFFYDAFTNDRESWNVISISAFDTPNLAGLTLESLLALPDNELDWNPYPQLITRRWVKERHGEWGSDHPSWQSRVLGNFPIQSEDALFALSWLEQAKLRTDGDGDLYAGIDVAGPGESETAWCVRQGPRIVAIGATTEKDARGRVAAALIPYKSRLKNVIVDTAGLGHYVARHLEDLGYSVVDLNGGSSPRNKERFLNRKAEAYWNLRDLAAAGELAGLTDDKTIAQLASIRYVINNKGQTAIERKEDALKRGVKSPDRAEAVILAFAYQEHGCPLAELLDHEDELLGRTSTTTRGVASCKKCGCDVLDTFRGTWRCRQCGHSETPACPACQSVAVGWIGSQWRCNICGVQFGAKPRGRSAFSRSEALFLADHGLI